MQSDKGEKLELRKLRRPLAILALSLLALAALPRLEPPAVATSRASGHVLANEVRHWDPAERGRVEPLGGGEARVASAGQSGGETVSITSEVVDAGQRFDHLGVHWRAAPEREDGLFVEVRWSADGLSWSDWEVRYEEEDMVDESANEHYAAPLPVGDARFAQYRVWLTDGDLASIRAVALTFLDVTDRNASPLTRLVNDVTAAFEDVRGSWSANAAVNTVPIRTRQQWRADESLMQWWPQYVPWKKAVIHHTVTTNSYSDATAEIRAIYYYHAVTRGWGDIGYNFLVDRFGAIWQGRQGGDDVIGGHAFGWNDGTIGVAALGNFSVTPPPSVMLNGMAHLVAMKFTPRGIAPTGTDTYTHKEEDRSGNWTQVTSNPPNVIGHRDCTYVIGVSGGQTACPGQALYNQLSTVRSDAQAQYAGGYAYLPHVVTNLPHVGNVGQTLPVSVTVKNAGRSTIGGASLVYRVLDPSRGYLQIAQGAGVPLGGDLTPGQSRILATALAVPRTAGRYLVRWDLLTPSGWLSQTANAPYRDEWLSAVDWDVTWLSDTTPSTLSVGQATTVNVTFQNTGARPWPAASVRLSYHWVSDVTQRMVVWDGNRAFLPFDVQPGQSVTVPIRLTAPTYPTRYRVQYDLVWDGSFWFSAKGSDLWEKTVNVPFDYKAGYQVPSTLTLTPDQQTIVPVTVTNTGSSTWPSSGGLIVDLGTHWYTSAGALVEWDGLRTNLGRDLGPGQSVTLQARVEAPSAIGTYQLRWDLSFEGVSWFSSKGVALGLTTVTVKAPTYGARYQPAPIGAISTSVTTTVPMTLTNTSDFAWSSPSFNLAYHVFDGSGKLAQWDGARTMFATPVAPGQSVTLQAKLTLPSQSGSYTVQWDMVHEGVTWFSGQGVPPASQVVTVGTLSYGASYDNSLAPSAMNTAMRWNVLVNVTNRSNFVFSPATNMFLAYHWLDQNGNAVVWDGARSPISLAAGQTAGVWAAVYGPPNPGSYRLAFDLVQEGVAWFSGKGVPMVTSAVAVRVPTYGAVYASSAEATGGAGQTVTVPVSLTNTGSLTWSSAQVFLAYHLYRNGALYVWDGARTALPTSLAPGQTATLPAAIRLPAAGAYEVRFDLVREGVTWFSSMGVPVTSLALTAQ